MVKIVNCGVKNGCLRRLDIFCSELMIFYNINMLNGIRFLFKFWIFYDLKEIFFFVFYVF